MGNCRNSQHVKYRDVSDGLRVEMPGHFAKRLCLLGLGVFQLVHLNVRQTEEVLASLHRPSLDPRVSLFLFL